MCSVTVSVIILFLQKQTKSIRTFTYVGGWYSAIHTTLNCIIDRESKMNSTDNVSSSYQCEEPYPNQKEILSNVSWWLEGITQIIIGCMGFAGNTIAIPVLSSRKLNSIFNRILVFLAGIILQRLFFDTYINYLR